MFTNSISAIIISTTIVIITIHWSEFTSVGGDIATIRGTRVPIVTFFLLISTTSSGIARGNQTRHFLARNGLIRTTKLFNASVGGTFALIVTDNRFVFTCSRQCTARVGGTFIVIVTINVFVITFAFNATIRGTRIIIVTH